MAQEATNTFNDGLNQDLHPIATKSSLLTDSKNATFITFNGNEMSLLNDMGNTKLVYTQKDENGVAIGNPEEVSLREGFVPTGMKEHGGILYITSKNAAGNCEIGSFPSPEYQTQLTPQAVNADELIVVGYDNNNQEVDNTNHNIQLLDDEINVCDYLSDYYFWNINYNLISLPNKQRKLYKYNIVNVLNGHDITSSCLNLDLTNRIACVYVRDSQNVSDTTQLVIRRNGNLILAILRDDNSKCKIYEAVSGVEYYYYEYPTKKFQNLITARDLSLYILLNEGDKITATVGGTSLSYTYELYNCEAPQQFKNFYFPNIQRSVLGINFSYETIDSFELRTYKTPRPTTPSVNNEVEFYGPTKSFEVGLTDTNNKYCILKFDSLFIKELSYVKVDEVKFEYNITDYNGTSLLSATGSKTLKILNVNTDSIDGFDLDISTFNVSLEDLGVNYKEPFNKCLVWFKITPINNLYNVDLSEFAIERTIDMAKSNESMLGTLTKDYLDVSINLMNILASERSTLRTIYRNAFMSDDYSKMLATNIFEKSKTTTSCFTEEFGEKELVVGLANDYNRGNSSDLNYIFAFQDDLESNNEVKKDSFTDKSTDDHFYIYDKPMWNRGAQSPVVVKGLNSKWNYTWIIRFISSSFSPLKISGGKISELFKYLVSSSTYDPFSSTFFYKILKTKDAGLSSFDTIPKTYTAVDYITSNYSDQYLYSESDGVRKGETIFKHIPDSVSCDKLFTETIPSKAFERYIIVGSTEDDYLESGRGVGNMGLFYLAKKDINNETITSDDFLSQKIGLKVDILSIVMNESDFEEVIKDALLLNFTTTSSGNKYKIDSNGNTLLNNESYNNASIILPDAVYCKDANNLKVPATLDGSPTFSLANKISGYPNSYLFKNNTGYYSRYIGYVQTATNPPVRKCEYTITFNRPSFDGSKYAMFLAYMRADYVEILHNENVKYQLGSPLFIDDEKTDYILNHAPYLDGILTINRLLYNKSDDQKYIRIACLVYLDSSLEDLTFTLFAQESGSIAERTSKSFILINPILYTFDELYYDEEENKYKCQYFRGLHMLLNNNNITQDSIYHGMKLPGQSIGYGELFNKVLGDYAPLPFYEY